MKKIIVFTLFIVLQLGVATSFACSAMGPNTHVGNILNVDSQAKTLTIQDVETNKPITFEVNDALLMKLASAKGQVIVRYSGTDGKLVATDIE